MGDVKVRSWVFIFLSLVFAIVLLSNVPATVCFFSHTLNAMIHGTVCSPREFQGNFRGEEFLKINHFEESVTLNKNFLRSEEARFF